MSPVWTPGSTFAKSSANATRRPWPSRVAIVGVSVLVMAALKLEDLEIRRYEPGSIVNKGVLGFLDRESMIVNIAIQENECDEVASSATSWAITSCTRTR